MSCVIRPTLNHDVVSMSAATSATYTPATGWMPAPPTLAACLTWAGDRMRQLLSSAVSWWHPVVPASVFNLQATGGPGRFIPPSFREPRARRPP